MVLEKILKCKHKALWFYLNMLNNKMLSFVFITEMKTGSFPEKNSQLSMAVYEIFSSSDGCRHHPKKQQTTTFYCLYLHLYPFSRNIT
jgi:hypothetical protein